METPDIKVAQMAVNAQDFAQGKVAGNFTHTPATKVDAKHADALAKLTKGINDLGGKEAIQSGGGFGLSTEVKGTSREELEALAKQANRTAGAIASDEGKPEIMNQFRMPHGSGDEALKTTINAMANAVDNLELGDDLKGMDSQVSQRRCAPPGQAGDRSLWVQESMDFRARYLAVLF